MERGARTRRSCAAVPLAAALVAAAFAAVPGLAAALGWERGGIAAGEWWRLVTGHLMHWDLRHAALNVVGALLLGWYFRRLPDTFWLLAALGSIAACAVGLFSGPAALDEYRGLSAVLYGWLVAALFVSAPRAGRAHAAAGGIALPQPARLLALGICCLVLADALGLLAPRALDAGVPVHGAAHAFGILGALAGALPWRALGRPARLD